MSRFCLNRKIVSVFSLFSLVFGGSSLVAPAVSYADASWMELLKPLVKDVIVPGASAGMKKLIEKKMKLKLNSSSDTETTFDNMDFSNMENVMSMPEEPTTETSAEGTEGDDNVMSMPEEPTYSASSNGGNVSNDTLSAPPPPIGTP